jgi:hypothetical protein
LRAEQRQQRSQGLGLPTARGGQGTQVVVSVPALFLARLGVPNQQHGVGAGSRVVEDREQRAIVLVGQRIDRLR